ncbi:MAG: tetratricopeptide repeat protein [bacterium]
MTDSDTTEQLDQAVAHIRARAYDEAIARLRVVQDRRAEGAETALLLELLCHVQQNAWDALFERTTALPEPLQLQLPLALRACMLVLGQQVDEALALGIDALFRPRTPPLDGRGDPDGLASGPLAALSLAPLDGVLMAHADGASPATQPILTFLRGAVALNLQEAATHVEQAVEDGLDPPAVLTGLARLLRLMGQRARALEVLTRAEEGAPDPQTAHRIAAEREACDRDEQLERARRVVLRRAGLERVVTTERGVYLSILDPSTGRETVELCGPGYLGSALRTVINGYLDHGYVIADWELDASLDELKAELREAQRSGSTEEALRIGRELVMRAPDDAGLATQALGAAVAYRGYAQSVTLSQRILALAEEPDWALRQHAALLWAAGHAEECLGTLLYLQEFYGPESMTPAAWELLASAFVTWRHRPALALQLLGRALAQHPGHPVLLELRARAQLSSGDGGAAVETLKPLLATETPHAQALVTALRAHLEGGLEGTEQLATRALKLHPHHIPLRSLKSELDGRSGAALKGYRTMLAEATSPVDALTCRIDAMRTALRVGDYEDALRLAREAQTQVGEPDARCLSVIYDSLRALEPTEDREDLAAMVEEATRQANVDQLDRGRALRAMLSAGVHLDPDLLENLWAELEPTPTSGELKPQIPELAEGLVCCATDTGFVTLFDEGGLEGRLSTGAWDWFQQGDALAEERKAGRLAVAAAPEAVESTVLWVRVTTQPLPDADRKRFDRLETVKLSVPTGRVFVGPGEALHGASPQRQTVLLGVELGGRHFYLPPGLYEVAAYRRNIKRWPAKDVRTEPCDVVFQLLPGRR